MKWMPLSSSLDTVVETSEDRDFYTFYFLYMHVQVKRHKLYKIICSENLQG